MAKVMTDESNYTAIASAIRSKLEVSTRYKPSEMASAIDAISTQEGILPSGYTEVEYIKCDGVGTYIDTGVIPNEQTIIKARVILNASVGRSDLNQAIFGSRKSSSIADPTSSMFCLWHYAANLDNDSRYRRMRCDYGYHNSNQYVSNSDITFAKIEFRKGILVLNGTQYTFSTDSIDENVYPIYIGAVNTAGSPIAVFFGYITKLSIQDGNNLIRDYVPCIRDTDNIAGFYDLINNTFSKSSGSTNFVSGERR